MLGHNRRDSSRSSRNRGRLALLTTAGAVVLLVLYLVIVGLVGGAREARDRAAVRGGKVQLEGVRVSWDVERGGLVATLYLLNTSDDEIQGDLMVEFRPHPDRLDEGYLEALVDQQLRRGSQEGLVANLEGSPRLSPKDRSLLAYLRRGDRTDNPGYESVIYERGERPEPLAFRKRTSRVVLPPQELSRVTVSQDLPEGRMGELVDRENTRIVDLEF